MTFIRANRQSLLGVYGGCLLTALLLISCVKPTSPVSIHGVNYSGEPFSYLVVDPGNPNNKGGGELIDSYAAGGTTCCYEMPNKWQPGIRISVQATHRIDSGADKTLHEVVETRIVDVPRYPEGKPGELWVLRASDGAISVVSSDLQPDHPNWPGKVKGWPVPSLKYQRQRWDIDIDHQRFFLNAYEELAAKFRSHPDVAAQEEWDNALKYDRPSLTKFSGPEDREFRRKLQQDNQDGIDRVRANLKQLQQGRP